MQQKIVLKGRRCIPLSVKTCNFSDRRMNKIQNIMARWKALQPLSDRDREMLSRRNIGALFGTIHRVDGAYLEHRTTDRAFSSDFVFRLCHI